MGEERKEQSEAKPKKSYSIGNENPYMKVREGLSSENQEVNDLIQKIEEGFRRKRSEKEMEVFFEVEDASKQDITNQSNEVSSCLKISHLNSPVES